MCYNSTPVHTEKHAGFKIEIWHDEDSPNPATDFDQPGEYTIFQSNDFCLSSSVKHPYSKDGFLEDCENGALDGYVLFLFTLDRYNALNARQASPANFEDFARFDGVWLISPDEIKKEWGETNTVLPNGEFTPQQMAERYGKAFLQEMDDYYMGNVYGYKVLDDDGEEVESVWGFIGDYDGYILEEARRVAEYEAKSRAEADKFAEAFMCC